MRVAWGLLAAYALFVAGLLLLRPADDWRGLVLAEGSLAVVVSGAVLAVSMFVARGRARKRS